MAARHLVRSWLLATVLAACGNSSPSADQPERPQRVCTLLFAYEGLELDVAGTWTDAPLTVEVTAGGKRVAAEARGSAQGPQCGAGATNQDLGCAARNDSFEIMVAPPMAADAPAHIRVTNVGAPGGPAEVIITVRHGARTVTRTLRPAYQATEPNGPGCGQVVKARESLTLGG